MRNVERIEVCIEIPVIFFEVAPETIRVRLAVKNDKAVVRKDFTTGNNAVLFTINTSTSNQKREVFMLIG